MDERELHYYQRGRGDAESAKVMLESLKGQGIPVVLNVEMVGDMTVGDVMAYMDGARSVIPWVGIYTTDGRDS